MSDPSAQTPNAGEALRLAQTARVAEVRAREIAELYAAAPMFIDGPVKAATARFSLRVAAQDLFIAARRARAHPVRTLRLWRDITLVRASGLIDPAFYAPQKAATTAPRFDDARNYVLVGHELDPNLLFSGSGYLALNPDLRGAEITPLAHYIRFGRKENRPTALSRRAHLAPTADPEARPRLSWPMAEGVPPDPQNLSLPRPDDDVLGVGEAGRDFMQRHGLLSAAPDFAGAVQALAQAAPSPALVAPRDARMPDVSIVIPVYGQLAYTLNGLDALVRHASRYSFEILVGDDVSPDATGDWLPRIPHLRHVRHAVNGGFIDNCNAVAALARGRFVVMLNNDTRVVPGWLDALIGSFELFPEAGLVGSKLFYDDGVLQEAGGIVWRDGSAWNYGRGDDPNRPRYCHARQVDYVSGASIALPTALWRELGGFDAHFRPAYCEDCDLAFRVRARGLQTWMQPLSKVIHYEGRTSGVDVTQGVKAYQVTNTAKLQARWAAELSASRPNGADPFLERERAVEKRVLVLDATTPTPNQDAGSVVTVIHMQLYQALGYKVTFAPMHDFLYQPQSDDLRRIGVECAYMPYQDSLESLLQQSGRYFDLVQVFRVEVAEQALELLRRYAPQAPIIFANADMHHLRMERQARVEHSPDLLARAAEMKVRELAVIGEADCNVVHSPVEADIIDREAPQARHVVFPFIAPLMGASVGHAPRRDVMFLGGYRHTPNVDAAVFLAQEIWPLVRPYAPGARLVLAGAHPTQEVRALAQDDIVVTGMIDDLRPWFDHTRVFAAALRYGAGVKGKVSTAMSFGVPVVATGCGAEGMFLQDGRDVLIADDSAAFAQAIVSLYNDPEAWARLSRNSLAFVAEWNSMDMGLRKLAEAIDIASAEYASRAAAALDGILHG